MKRSCGSGFGAFAWTLAMLIVGCGQSLQLLEGPAQPTGPFSNVRVTVRGDTAIVEFEPLLDARDYRIYVEPDPADVMNIDGVYAVRDAVYRCAGDRPLVARETLGVRFDQSLENDIYGYHRTAAQNVLGHVYLTPGEGRVPVYRVADPNANGGYLWEYNAPPAKEYNGADYVVDAAARDALLARGWRDDGIAFYTSATADSPIYRREYVGHSSIFYGDGAEHDAHEGDDLGTVVELGGERFRVLSESGADTVPLYRVRYMWAAEHDVLAAGEERYQRVLHQGNRPVTSLSWPGLTGTTNLVIEALDAGCPFAGGHIGVEHRDASGHTGSYPTWTPDEARNPSTGELFINGQHDPANRPRPIARTTVTASPQALPGFDWHQDFDIAAPWQAPVLAGRDDGYNALIYRSPSFSVEFVGCFADPAFGPLLGRFDVETEGCGMQLIPRDVAPSIAADRFLHVRMSTAIPSTKRRFPQIWITTATLGEDVASFDRAYHALLLYRLGPEDPSMLGEDQTIIVQTFADHELQVQFCDQRGWGTSRPCPPANVYGPHTGNSSDVAPWLPVPVLGELASSDRLVQLDVYASTARIYVMADGEPVGCAVLPAGRMPEGPVTVAFGTIGDHIEIDEFVVPEGSRHAYWGRYAVTHLARQFDDLAIELVSTAPPWNESILPCGERWMDVP